MEKVLYFEGAGYPGATVSKATIGNCRIRSAFHLDDGTPVYLELIGSEVTKHTAEHLKSFKYAGRVDEYARLEKEIQYMDKRNFQPFEYNRKSILRLVNSLGCSFDRIEVLPNLSGYRVFGENGEYNFADEFEYNKELATARISVEEYLENREKERGEKYLCFDLLIDSEDPAILHFKNGRRKESFILCVADPKDMESLPTLYKENAVPGCVYRFCDAPLYVHEVYSVSEEYAKENHLAYRDRVKTSAGDFALIQ